MNHTLSDSQLEAMIKSAVNSSGPLPPDEKFSQLVSALRELQERRKAERDSEPVAWTWHYREQWHVTNDKRRAEFVAKDGDVAVLPLYRHAQQPVVPDGYALVPLKPTKDMLTAAEYDHGADWQYAIDIWDSMCRAAMLAASRQELKK